MGVIGDTLYGARTRRAIDLEEVESATGIRTRYLLAIEAESWEALPEEFYVRSFIRKYAQHLGVDPEPLVAEYRRQRGTTPGPGEAPTSPFARTSSRRAETLRRRRKRQGAYAWLAAGAVVAAVVVVIVLLTSGGGGGGSKPTGAGEAGAGAAGAGKDGSGTNPGKGAADGGTAKHPGAGKGGAAAGHAGASTVTLKIEPTAEVWACVEDAAGKPLVAGLILAKGQTMGPFHSRSFTVAFGNGSVALTVDGKRAHTSSSSSPIGLTIDRHGKVHQLPEGRRPSCE